MESPSTIGAMFGSRILAVTRFWRWVQEIACVRHRDGSNLHFSVFICMPFLNILLLFLSSCITLYLHDPFCSSCPVQRNRRSSSGKSSSLARTRPTSVARQTLPSPPTGLSSYLTVTATNASSNSTQTADLFVNMFMVSSWLHHRNENFLVDLGLLAIS